MREYDDKICEFFKDLKQMPDTDQVITICTLILGVCDFDKGMALLMCDTLSDIILSLAK